MSLGGDQARGAIDTERRRVEAVETAADLEQDVMTDAIPRLSRFVTAWMLTLHGEAPQGENAQPEPNVSAEHRAGVESAKREVEYALERLATLMVRPGDAEAQAARVRKFAHRNETAHRLRTLAMGTDRREFEREVCELWDVNPNDAARNLLGIACAFMDHREGLRRQLDRAFM